MSCLGQKYKRCQISSPAVKTQELKNQRPHFNPQDHGLEKLQSNSDFWFKLKQLKITKSDNLLLNEHKFLLFYSSETTLIADCRKIGIRTYCFKKSFLRNINPYKSFRNLEMTTTTRINTNVCCIITKTTLRVKYSDWTSCNLIRIPPCKSNTTRAEVTAQTAVSTVPKCKNHESFSNTLTPKPCQYSWYQ